MLIKFDSTLIKNKNNFIITNKFKNKCVDPAFVMHVFPLEWRDLLFIFKIDFLKSFWSRHLFFFIFKGTKI